ncbi:hypothetical protein KKF64_00700 [Patescibacteria group bacterium]|nr:hypothetical protein [Patescibacteria group bacterium]
MNVKIKRIDKSLPLSQYETQGAVAFDFIARENTVIEPNGIGRVPTNTIVEIPEGYMLLIKDRSGTAKKKGILMTAGIIDQDYCGDNDEILMQFYNPSDTAVTVERGEKLAQGIFVSVGIGEWDEVDKMNKKDRGGFGSTDEKNGTKQEDQKVLIDSIHPKVSRKGKLIVIDGIDGAGKTTQIGRLVNRLIKQGHDVVTADFPQYGTKSAGLVEEYLNGKYGASEDVSPYVASFFYALDRYDASFKIRSWLNQGKVVITDRYVSANMGHQGGKFETLQKRREYFRWLDYYEYTVFGIPRPDMTLVLHIPHEYSQDLMKAREDKKYIENEDNLDIHESDNEHLRHAEQTYLEMCEEFDDFELIECVQDGRLLSIEEVSELVWEKAKKTI